MNDLVHERPLRGIVRTKAQNQGNHCVREHEMERELSPALKPYPSKLIVETTTRCNLQCPMCLKNTGQRPLVDADMTSDMFARLIPSFSRLQVLVLNGIGEPLLHPSLNEFIAMARRHMPAGSWIGFQSNGVMIDARRAEALLNAGLDRICISVDAAKPERFSRIRKGGDIAGVDRALMALNSARMREGSSLEVGIEFVLRNDNMEDLPMVIRWAGSRGVDFVIVTHLVPYHRDLSSQMAYAVVSDVSVDVFRNHLDMADRMNVDVRRYYDVFMKPMKTREDRKIMNLVESLRSMSSHKGLPSNITTLFRMDLAKADRVQTVLEEARVAASSCNIELKLPSVYPRKDRKCEFVEEGCAFVSVDGGVHPCYELWHQHGLHVNDTEVTVGSRSFGDLSFQDILDIWNGSAFVNFRKNVLTYQYPYCFDCSFAICGNMNTEEFERDCHLNTEPCGACLWCRGVLQCLK